MNRSNIYDLTPETEAMITYLLKLTTFSSVLLSAFRLLLQWFNFTQIFPSSLKWVSFVLSLFLEVLGLPNCFQI